MRKNFWRDLRLEALDEAEWEALCDGCGLCCLVKLEDEEDGRIYFTRLLCELYDPTACRCGDYENRQRKIPGCLRLTPEAVAEIEWLPPSCAYRLRAEGKPLPQWHYLVCGDRDAVHRVGVSVQDWTRSEKGVSEDEMEDFLVRDPFAVEGR